MNSARLLAAPAAGGWPAFRDIDLEAARATAVPAYAGDLEASATATDLCNLDLPVENPSGLKAQIKAADKTGDLVVTAVRKGYGNYEAGLEVSGGTDTFKVLKLGPGRYLVRGGEVNLTAAQDASGKYFDVSGDIPMPAADTAEFRLKVSTDGTLDVEEPGYTLALRPDRATGAIDLKVFSKADAACLIALGLAINSDRLAPDPSWTPPPEPGPWVRVPYTPGPNGVNPWDRLQITGVSTGNGSGGKGGGGGGKTDKSSKKAPAYSDGNGDGGGGRGGGGRGGGGRGGGGSRGSSAGGRSSGDEESRGGGGGRERFTDSRSGGRRGPGEAGRGRPYGPVNSGAGRAAPMQKPAAGAASARTNARADRAKPAAGKSSASGKKQSPVKRPGDSRSLARNVTNSLGEGKLRPFTERKAAEIKTPPAAKTGGPAAKAPRQKARFTAGAFTKADNKPRSLNVKQNILPVAAGVPPRPDFRDSLNDAPVRGQPAQAAPAVSHSKRAPAALTGTVTALTHTVAALTRTMTKAISSLGAAVNAVLTWLKTLA